MNYAFPQITGQSRLDSTVVLYKSARQCVLPENRRLRVNENIARDLGIAITSGFYGPGDRLADELSASKRLKVSRSAYREAVRTLVEKGLLESLPKVGTTVTPRQKWNLLDPDVLAWIFSREPDLSLLESLFELRTLVESEAASMAAKRRTKEQLWRMRIALKQLTGTTLGTNAALRATREFHTLILHATANPFLLALASGVIAALDATTRFQTCECQPQRDPIPDYTDVFRAIENMDSARAKRGMEELIHRAFLDMPLSKR